MKILFIDESKKLELKKRKFFLLLGVVVDSEKMFRLESKLRILKSQHSLNNFKQLKTNNLNIKEKKKICRKMVDILKEFDCFVLSIILGPITMKNVQSFEDCYLEAIGFLIDRFFLNLNMSKDFGWVVHDSVEGSEKNFKEGFKKYVTTQIFSLPKWKYGYKISERVYPCLSFFDDNHCEILQCSDLIALALNNAIWKRIKELSEHDLQIENLKDKNDFLKIYWDLFVKNPKTGEVNNYGIKLWL